MSSGGSWHKKDWIAAAALAAAAAATVATAGAAAPTLGAAATGAGAVGAGAGAAGAGIGAGAGATALTGAEMLTANSASMLPGLLGSGAVDAGAASALTGAEALTANGASMLPGLTAQNVGAADLATSLASGSASNGANMVGMNPLTEGLLGKAGGMGPEQAAILAQQNAGMGVGADMLTLDAANGTNMGSGLLKMGGKMSNLAEMKGAGQVAQSLMAPPQQQAMAPPPQQPQMQEGGPSGQSILGNFYGDTPQLPPGITPEMLKDPRILALLRSKGLMT